MMAINQPVHCQESSSRSLCLPPSSFPLSVKARTGPSCSWHLPPLARLSPHYKRVSRSALDYQSEGGRGCPRGVEARQMKMREVGLKCEQNVLKPHEVHICMWNCLRCRLKLECNREEHPAASAEPPCSEMKSCFH